MNPLNDLLPEELLAEATRLLAENTQLKLDAEQKEKDCEGHLTTINEQAETISQLQNVAKSKLSSVELNPKEEKLTIPEEPIEHKGKQYKWQVAKFRLSGDHKAYTAKDASADADLVKRILAIQGQGILKELV